MKGRRKYVKAISTVLVFCALCAATSGYARGYGVASPDSIGGVPLNGAPFLECTASGLGGETIILLPTRAVAADLAISTNDQLWHSRPAPTASINGSTAVTGRMLAYRQGTGQYVIVAFVTTAQSGSGGQNINIGFNPAIMGNGSTNNGTNTVQQYLGSLVVKRTNLPLHAGDYYYKWEYRGFKGVLLGGSLVLVVFVVILMFRRRD